eukprot:scaffold131967_cov63-Phaeocystis_antarctica.AAC.1
MQLLAPGPRARRPAPRFVCCKLRVVTFYHLCNISQKLGLRRHVTVTVWCNCNCKRQRRTPPSPHPQTERALPHTALRELQNPRSTRFDRERTPFGN